MTPEQSETLTRVEQSLKDLGAQNKTEHESIRLTQSDIYEKLDSGKTEMYQALNNRPKWSVTMWLLGGVFAALMIIGTMVYNIEDTLESHIDAGIKVWMQDNPGKDAPDLRGD